MAAQAEALQTLVEFFQLPGSMAAVARLARTSQTHLPHFPSRPMVGHA
jgi:hypothetical protein